MCVFDYDGGLRGLPCETCFNRLRGSHLKKGTEMYVWTSHISVSSRTLLLHSHLVLHLVCFSRLKLAFYARKSFFFFFFFLFFSFALQRV